MQMCVLKNLFNNSIGSLSMVRITKGCGRRIDVFMKVPTACLLKYLTLRNWSC